MHTTTGTAGCARPAELVQEGICGACGQDMLAFHLKPEGNRLRVIWLPRAVQTSIPLPIQPEIRCQDCGADLRGVNNRVETPTGFKCYPCSKGLGEPRMHQRGLPL